MVTGRLIFSFIVVAVVGLGLSAVWHPAFFDPAHNFLSTTWNEIVTAILVSVAFAMLACAWCKKRGEARPPTCCTDEADDSRKKKYQALPDPYPNSYGKKVRITAFQYRSHLYILRLKRRLGYTDREEQYIVAKDYTVRYKLNGGAWQAVTVPRGTMTDLSSSPWPARLFVGRVGPHLEASIVHDYLYIAWQVKGLIATDEMRRFADDLMLVAMREAGMGCMADIIYRAILLVGRCTFYGRNPEPLILCDKKLPACCIDRTQEGADPANRQPRNDE